mmetsp:Transcript_96493/g.273267  ORF Transcript_96493/g.273267 Transcript_96493/m.273267 type:complete len:86 (+) Transcript_96493:1504-1761(+)
MTDSHIAGSCSMKRVALDGIHDLGGIGKDRIGVEYTGVDAGAGGTWKAGETPLRGDEGDSPDGRRNGSVIMRCELALGDTHCFCL